MAWPELKRLSGCAACALIFCLLLNLVPAHSAGTAGGAAKKAQPALSKTQSKTEPKSENKSDLGTGGKSEKKNESPAEFSETVEEVPALPPADDSPPAKVEVHVRMAVPQMNERTDSFGFYPYITKPMKIFKENAPLNDIDPAAFKSDIMQAAYTNRQSLTKAYPAQGWRFQYAYHNALSRSGLREPKSMVGLYGFCNKLIPYLKPECQRINRIEIARRTRYEETLIEYEDNHKDEEGEALRLNRTPINLPMHTINAGKMIEGTALVPPGDWYLTGQHRVPGLIYYWQEKIKVKPNKKLSVDLTDANAMLIQGGW